MGSAKRSLSELFAIGLQLERGAHLLYSKWSRIFEAHPEISEYWQKMAMEELGHAEALEIARSQLSTRQLQASLDAKPFQVALDLLNKLKEEEERVRHLEDAYQLANKIEHSEVNTLFEFLVTQSNLQAVDIQEVRSNISRHIESFSSGFPKQFDSPQVRENIKVH